MEVRDRETSVEPTFLLPGLAFNQSQAKADVHPPERERDGGRERERLRQRKRQGQREERQSLGCGACV